MLLCLGVQNLVSDKSQIYVFIVTHLVAVTVEFHDELFVAAVVTVGLHFLRRFVQKKNDRRCVAGDFRRICDLTG